MFRTIPSAFSEANAAILIGVPTERQPRKDAAANRERVLDAATELVRREGEKVPMADIADRAGVGVGTVYRHFPTREDLLGALVHRSFGLAVDNARAAAAHPGSALDGIRLFFLATLRDRDRFVLPLHGGPLVFTPATRQRQADVRTVLRGLIERGQAARRATRGSDPRRPHRRHITALTAAARNRRLGAPGPQADRPDDLRPRPHHTVHRRLNTFHRRSRRGASASAPPRGFS